jgi:hypothetical protein
MSASKSEQVLSALKALLETVPNASVERNGVLPEKIPDGGLIILRDGDPGEPEQTLGGFGNTYYRHEVEIEVCIETRHIKAALRTMTAGAKLCDIESGIRGLLRRFGLKIAPVSKRKFEARIAELGTADCAEAVDAEIAPVGSSRPFGRSDRRRTSCFVVEAGQTQQLLAHAAQGLEVHALLLEKTDEILPTNLPVSPAQRVAGGARPVDAVATGLFVIDETAVLQLL